MPQKQGNYTRKQWKPLDPGQGNFITSSAAPVSPIRKKGEKLPGMWDKRSYPKTKQG